jgi:hypothetical protein
MLRIEATIRSDTHIPSSITGTGTDRVSPKVKTHQPDQMAMWSHANLISVAPNWSSDVLVSGAAAKLLLWALLKLLSFEP